MRATLHVAAPVGLTLLLAAAQAATPMPGQAQAPPRADQPVFRTEVNMVEVDVVAIGPDGRPTPDLRREDFQVLQDGKPQPIVSFALVNLPVNPPHPSGLPDVATNERAGSGRLFFILLDDVNSLRSSSAEMRAVARRLVERLAPGDQVALQWVSLRKDGAREFTANHATILQAIDRFAAESSLVERRMGMRSTDSMSADFDVSGFFDRTRLFNIIKDVSDYLARIPHRRKALVYVGSGPAGLVLSDRALGRASGAPQRESPIDPSRGEDWDIDVTKAIMAARRANVAFYPLAPGAPSRLGEEGFTEEEGPLVFRDRARLRRDNLGLLGEAMGGFAGSTRNASAVDRIVADTSCYYLLGYVAPNANASGVKKFFRALSGDPWSGYHRIEVRTTRPGLTVRAREGYWDADVRLPPAAPPPGLPEVAVARSVSGILPASGLALRAFAAPFRGRAGRKPTIALAVEINAPEFQPASPGAGMSEDVQMIVVAVEPGEKVRTLKRVSARMTLGAEKARLMSVPRYLLCARVDVPPGQYQLRVGVSSSTARRTGSVFVDVTVPDFAAAVLSMSGIAIDQRTTAAPMPAARADALAAVLPFTPSLAREFRPSDDVAAFVRVYRGTGSGSQPVRMATALERAGEETILWRVEEERPASTFGRAGETEYRVRLPLDQLAAGTYRLRITAARAGDLVGAQREIDFRVRAGAGS